MTEVRSKTDVADLLDRYIALLDERRFTEWLELFTDQSYYTMILREDYAKNTNMLAIGEDKIRLAGRIEVGQNVERAFTTHLLSGLTIDEEGAASLRASCNFAVIRSGGIVCWGRYHISLVRLRNELRIERCTAVLNNNVIRGTIYLPV
jgi:3-phenylpropionate/cinnamic acid dioxygenase small subunit